jgi:hypothetical protein
MALPIALLIALSAAQLAHVSSDKRASSLIVGSDKLATYRTLNDFDLFYIVGRLYREGDIQRAYSVDYLLEQQERFTGVRSMLPWTYPPQYTAAVALLALVPIEWAFFLFVGGSLIFFLAVLHRIDRQHAGAGLLAVYPALALNARLGQNGFLTAGFIGLFVLGYAASRQRGGLALGLLAMKPHLGVALGLLALIDRRWKALATGVAVAAVMLAIATAVLGIGIWPSFFAGVRESSALLLNAEYSLYRKASVYGTLRSFGMSADASLAVHAVVALAGLAAVLAAYMRRWPMNRLLALTIIVNLFISPYNHDYDYACVAIAVALVMPELIERARLRELFAFFVLAWIGTGAGLAQHFRAVLVERTMDHPRGSSLDWSIEAIGALAAVILTAAVLRRPGPADDEGQTAPARFAQAQGAPQ